MNSLRKLLIKKVIVYLRVLRIYYYDMRRFYRYSNVQQDFTNEDAFKGRLTILYHVIEKGLTMPETRMGFGQPVVEDLLGLLQRYEDLGYNKTALEFKHSIGVLNEYFNFHEESNFELPEVLVIKHKAFVNRIGLAEGTRQLKYTREEFFKFKNSSFETFSQSRYSSRNYIDKEISLDVIENCIKLALKSPTSCNRQLNRIYVVRGTEMKKKVLQLQYGNRGFGHLANTILVLSANISYFQGVNDRNESYINTGMFAMSLLNAFHHYEIGACPLNWSVDHKRDEAMRALLGVPDNERIGLVVSCGYVPELFEIASSPRLEVKDVAKIFN
ncbi:MAG: nitroreductase family protein [Cytophagales bacterium]|nr:nitroreductase family protein [Cytophagales bacterium]